MDNRDVDVRADLERINELMRQAVAENKQEWLDMKKGDSAKTIPETVSPHD